MLGGVVLQHQDDHLLRLLCCCSVVRSSADLDENARFDKNYQFSTPFASCVTFAPPRSVVLSSRTGYPTLRQLTVVVEHQWHVAATLHFVVRTSGWSERTVAHGVLRSALVVPCARRVHVSVFISGSVWTESRSSKRTQLMPI